MHVTPRKISFLGILLALSLIFQLAGAFIEISTLAFLLVAALLVGIACFETGLRLGGGFFIASVLLSFFLMPDKFYCLTYSVAALYIYVLELIRIKTSLNSHPLLQWIVRLLIFNGGFLFPALYFFPQMLISSGVTLEPYMYALIAAGANLFLLLFDRIYRQLIPNEWQRLKNRLHIRW